jgi:hypothetical protein
MSPAKRRRRLPTVVNRGLGLLEVILPCGSIEEGESSLPPGQRDSSGFWFPVGYDRPGDIFSPLQRRLQEHQRQIQRRRVNHRDRVAPVAGDGAPVPPASSGAPHAPPDAGGPAAALPPEIPLPLPPAFSDTHLNRHASENRDFAPLAARPRGREGSRSAETAILPDPDRIAAPPPSGLVDSREGSD